MPTAKRLLGAVLSLCIAIGISTQSFAAEPLTEPYNVRIEGAQVQFFKGETQISSFPIKSPADLRMVSNEQKDLILQFRLPDGNLKNITLGAQKTLTLGGQINKLSMAKSFSPDISVSLAPTSKTTSVEIDYNGTVVLGGKASNVKVAGAAKVSVSAGASVSTMVVSNRHASVSADKMSKVSKTYAASGASVTGTSTVKPLSQAPSSTPSNGGSGSSGSSGGSGGSGGGNSGNSGSTDSQEKIVILGVYPKLAGLSVELSQPVTLTTAAFKVVCPAGDDMTILNAYPSSGSEGNKLYNLSTSYFKDNLFILYVTLPDGSVIEKQFRTNVNAPVLTAVAAERTGETTATLSFNSDNVGTAYYLAVPSEAVQMVRSAVSDTAPQSADEVKTKGVAVTVSEGHYESNITGLSAESAYRIYLASEGNDSRKPVMQPAASLEAVAEQPPEPNALYITDIHMLESTQTIELRFSETVPSGTRFEVTCPTQSSLHYNVIDTDDHKTFRISMEKGYFLNSNNTLEVKAILPDGRTLQKSVYADVTAPKIESYAVVRTGESSIKVTFTASEGGTWYCLTNPTDYNMPPANIISNGTSGKLVPGGNTITLDNIPDTDKVVYMVAKDIAGNITTYVERANIPEKPQDPGTDPSGSITITNVTAALSPMNTTLTVTFSEEFDPQVLVDGTGTSNIFILDIIEIGNQTIDKPSATSSSPSNGMVSKIYITYNVRLVNGTYKLTVHNLPGGNSSINFTVNNSNS